MHEGENDYDFNEGDVLGMEYMWMSETWWVRISALPSFLLRRILLPMNPPTLPIKASLSSMVVSPHDATFFSSQSSPTSMDISNDETDKNSSSSSSSSSHGLSSFSSMLSTSHDSDSDSDVELGSQNPLIANQKRNKKNAGSSKKTHKSKQEEEEEKRKFLANYQDRGGTASSKDMDLNADMSSLSLRLCAFLSLFYLIMFSSKCMCM